MSNFNKEYRQLIARQLDEKNKWERQIHSKRYSLEDKKLIITNLDNEINALENKSILFGVIKSKETKIAEKDVKVKELKEKLNEEKENYIIKERELNKLKQEYEELKQKLNEERENYIKKEGKDYKKFLKDTELGAKTTITEENEEEDKPVTAGTKRKTKRTNRKRKTNKKSKRSLRHRSSRK